MNAVEVARRAVELWRGIHGDESLYLQCQRFDGYYWQWAYQGDESGIVVYASAAAAGRASAMFTSDVNAAEVQPGDLVYWAWGTYGHVGTVVGRDGARTLVTHTARSGDVLLELGNGVRVSHADSLGLQVLGVSHANGGNRPRTGLEPYVLGAPAPAPAPAQAAPPAPQETTVSLPEPWFVFPSADAAINARKGHRGPLVSPGSYAVRQVDRGAIRIDAGWLHPKAQAHIRQGAQPAAPAQQRFVRLDTSWFVFDSEGAARGAQRGHRGSTIPAGDYRILAGDGPYLIDTGNDERWIGTGRTNPQVVWK